MKFLQATFDSLSKHEPDLIELLNDVKCTY